MKFSAFLSLAAVLASLVNGFWRMECRARSGLARIDPLVSLGKPASHAHAIHGSSGFSMTSGYNELVNGACTSCLVSQDKSVYWTPALYFQDENTGLFTLVNQVGGMLAYYKLNNLPDGTGPIAFPKGFQMIAGDSARRNTTFPNPPQKAAWNTGPYNSQDFLRQMALGFNCLHYQRGDEPSLYRHNMPDKNFLDTCDNGLRLELMFPACWDGVHVDSVNHKDHVAYQSQMEGGGSCPEEFPVLLPGLFYETIWATNEYIGKEGRFVLANGDPTGYGYHGDFQMGWDPELLHEAVKTCTDPSGLVQACPLFEIQDSNVYSNCDFTLPTDLDADNVVGPMSTLPGNPFIVEGPGPASEIPDPEHSTDISAPAVSSPAMVPSAVASNIKLHDAPVAQAFARPTIFHAPVPATTIPPTTPSHSSSSLSGDLQSVTYITSTAYTTKDGGVIEEVFIIEEVLIIKSDVVTVTVVPTGHALKHVCSGLSGDRVRRRRGRH